MMSERFLKNSTTGGDRGALRTATLFLVVLMLTSLSSATGLATSGSAAPWHVIAAEPEPDTEWSSNAQPFEDLLPEPLRKLLPREVPPDVNEVALREHEDRLTLRVTPVAAGRDEMTPRENLSSATFTLGFILRHTADAADTEDMDVEGVYRLTVDLDGLVELAGTGTGTNQARYGLKSTEAPWAFELDIPKNDLLKNGRLQIGDQLTDIVATLTVRHEDGREAEDRVPDDAHGAPYRMTWAPGAAAPIPTWSGVAGTDFAAGPAAAFDSADNLYVSYLVYNGDRSTRTGAYLAHVTATGIEATRVGDVSFPTDLHEDERTRTALAAEPTGHLHMLYHPEPGEAHGGSRIAYVHATTKTSGGIAGVDRVEDPASAQGARAPFDGYAGQPDIIASGSRTIACYATDKGHGISIVERTAPGQWTLVRNIDDARFCRLDLDSKDRLHVAWFRETDASREVFEGDLVYATEADGWKETTIAKSLRDQTAFWETTGVNGGFDFDLDANDIPAFVYEGQTPGESRSRYDGPMYARLEQGQIERAMAPGLVPRHGNPQLVIWMDHDADGYMHTVTGYGSLDSYGMRAPDGRWYYETDLDRTDALAFAVDSEGRATVVGTQPHGGTTLEVVQASFRAEPTFADGHGPVMALPGPGPALIVAALICLLVAMPTSLRYTADRAPRIAAPGLAFVGGFSRLRKNQMLDHTTRDRIVRAIEADPGASPTTLQRQLDIPRSTFFYHLARLEGEGLIRVARSGRHLRCHPPGRFPRMRPADPLDLIERDQRILEMTRRFPGQRSGYYAEELGWNQRTVHERLRELERRDLVARDRVGPRDVRWTYSADPIDENECDMAS